VKVLWSEEAQADLARVFDFNLRFSETWAMRVDARLAERAEALGRSPFMGPAADVKDLRRLSVPDIQYVIFYRVTQDQVSIAHIYHTRENRT
jgi:plasmid stabilization system protein ParE